MSIKINYISQNIIEIIIEKDFLDNSVEEFKQKIANHNLDKNINIILNFKNTEFISSSGIAGIGALYNIMKQHNGRLIFVGLNSRIKSLFKMIKLTKEILIYKTLEEALEKLKGKKNVENIGNKK